MGRAASRSSRRARLRRRPGRNGTPRNRLRRRRRLRDAPGLLGRELTAGTGLPDGPDGVSTGLAVVERGACGRAATCCCAGTTRAARARPGDAGRRRGIELCRLEVRASWRSLVSSAPPVLGHRPVVGLRVTDQHSACAPRQRTAVASQTGHRRASSSGGREVAAWSAIGTRGREKERLRPSQQFQSTRDHEPDGRSTPA